MSASSISCPCCNNPIRSPSFELIVDHYEISPQSARVLEAVWKGKGVPVPSERILDHIWADDPDGGPVGAKRYRYFQWSLHELRKRLEGSGLAVVNAGYGCGYQLVAGGQANV
jgi:DNA-binding response OmpR family regulator